MEYPRNHALEFQKLGLVGAYTTSTTNNPIDRQPVKANLLKTSFLDIENIGSVLNIDPRIVLRLPSTKGGTSSYKYNSFRTWKLPLQEENYAYAGYELNYKFFTNALHFFHFGKLFYKVESNNFFKKYATKIKQFRMYESPIWRNPEPGYGYGKVPLTYKLGERELSMEDFQISGVFRPSSYGCNNLPFVRLSTQNGTTDRIYAQLVSQTKQENQLNFTPYTERVATGNIEIHIDSQVLPNFERYFNSGTSGANISSIKKATTKSLKSQSYLTWNSSITNGLNSSYFLPSQTPGFGIGIGESGYTNFYIPYPNSISIYKPVPFKCPTKIAFIDAYKDLEINGLLVITTGSPQNGVSKICYVSPHNIKPILANTIIEYYSPFITSRTSGEQNKLITGFKRNDSIVQIHSFDLTSKYKTFYSKNLDNPDLDLDHVAIGKNGLDSRPSAYQYVDDQTFQTTSVAKTHITDNNFCLQQTVPLKDTPFYKFYNNLYTGAKTLNTGTWDGVIPSGAFVNVELISTTLETEIGTNLDSVLVYSNYNSDDAIDQKILRAYNPINFDSLLHSVNIKNNGTFSYIGYSTAETTSEAIQRAQLKATKKINQIIRKLIRIKLPEICVFNRKYRKLQAYNARVNNKKLTNSFLSEIPEQYKLSITKY